MLDTVASSPGSSGLFGGGKTGDLIRSKDWKSTGLGAIESWPAELKINVQTVLSSPVPMVVLWGADGILLYNDGYAQVCGPRHPEALGGKVLEIWPEARDFNARVIAAGLTGETLSFQAQELELWRHGRPEQVFMDLEYLPIRNQHGEPVGSLAMVFDITARVLAEQQLAKSEELYRFLDDLGQAVGGLEDADAVLATSTRMVAEHLSITNCAYADMDDDQDGFTIRGNWHAPGSPSIIGRYRLAAFGKLAVQELNAGRPLIINDNLTEIAPEEAETFQNIGITATICMPLIKDGRLAALMAIHDNVPHRWSDYELRVIREVTDRSWAHVERVGAEANLRASEEQLRLAIDAAEIGLWDVDEINQTLFWPPRVKAMFGISPDVAVSMDDFYAGLHPEDRDTTAAAYASAAAPARRTTYDVEYRTIGKEDGVVRWIAAKGRGVFAGDVCIRVIGTAIDITARKAIEQSLRELNETLEQRIADALAERKLLTDVVENTTAIILVADRDFRWLAVNKAAAAAFEAVYGVQPRVGASMLDVLRHLPEEQEHVRKTWSRALAGHEFTIVDEFGDPGRQRRSYEITFNRLCDAAGQQIGAYQIVHDVTDRIREQQRLAEAEQQLRQAQKVESLGQLTGGVAHDFNNLLTPIVGTLDLLARKQFGGEREQRLIAGAMQSAERAAVLVQRLLAFARRQPLQPTSIDIRELITGMSELIASTTGPQIKVVTDLADNIRPAQADFNQLEMALLNLCVNARDAMPEGGTLRISASVRNQSKSPKGQLREGSYIVVSVADTGSGMDAQTVARAIEPFFSTKGVGKGTGLGLSMVHGLARQLGGELRIFSRQGYGTNIELWLPVAEDQRSGVAAPVRNGIGSQSYRGIALLVDDDILVRASTADMLEDAGFKVAEAGSAEEALRLLDELDDVAVLVTDHLMAGMSGSQLVRQVQDLRSGLPCLIVSGYADVEGISPDLPRLTKPFKAADLGQALSALGIGKK